MRTVILVAVSVLVLVGGFVLVSALLPDPRPSTAPEQGSGTQVAGRPGDGMGAEAIVLRDFDGDRLAAEFSADRYTPAGEDRVEVVNPAATFHLKDGRTLRITAEGGEVETSPVSGDGPSGMPRTGTLRQVRLELREPQDTGPEPALTALIDNLAFDYARLELRTADTEINGRPILGERVPVTVVGRDYDFTGRGLTVRFNDVNNRLELLRVHSGRRLTIKDPELLNKLADPEPVAAAEFPYLLAQADDAARAQPLPTYDGEAYAASFRRNVRVTQGGEPLAVAGSVLAVFATGGEDPEPSGDDTPEPAEEPQPGARPGREPAAEPEPVAGDVPDPVVIEWEGELRVQPAGVSSTAMLRGPEDMFMTLEASEGLPVVLTRDGARFEAQSLEYGAQAEFVRASGDAERPAVTLVDAEGRRVEATQIQYDGVGMLARLNGPGLADIPASESEEAGGGVGGEVGGGVGGEPMTLAWQGLGLLQLADAGTGRHVSRAEFGGGVRFERPRVTLDAQTLALAFDPPAADADVEANRPADVYDEPLGDLGAAGRLTRVTAGGDVAARLEAEDGGPARTVDAQRLVIFTGEDAGRIVPTRVEAVGDVRADAGGETLEAGALAADLRPAAGGEDGEGGGYELANLVARDGVSVRRGELSARADLLLGSGGGATQRWKLTAADDGAGNRGQVELRRGADVLNVDSLTYAPATGEATLPGAGSATLMVPPPGSEDAGGGGAEVPLAVAWEGGATIAADGTIEIVGPLTAESEADEEMGTQVLTASAAAATVTMRDTPGGDGDEVAREPDRLTLRGEAEVLAELTGSEGGLLRRVRVTGPTISFDATGQGLSVPAAGTLLYEDYRPPAEEPEVAGDEGPGFGSFRGSAGVIWSGSLVADLAGERVEVVDDVRLAMRRTEPGEVGQVGEDGGPDRLKVRADRLTATLAKRGDAAAELRTARLEGEVDFFTKDLAFLADTVTYDAAGTRLVASGSPMQLLGTDGSGRGSVGEVVYDTAARQIVRMTDLAGRATNAAE